MHFKTIKLRPFGVLKEGGGKKRDGLERNQERKPLIAPGWSSEAIFRQTASKPPLSPMFFDVGIMAHCFCGSVSFSLPICRYVFLAEATEDCVMLIEKFSPFRSLDPLGKSTPPPQYDGVSGFEWA